MLSFLKYFFSALLFSMIMNTCISFAAPTEKEVLAAMRKASDFMVNTVSYNGGYANTYTSDLSEQWGEAPFRRTMISVQGSTPRMGTLFLETYKATGDEYYLRCAEKAANALIWGQHPLGGWNYYIDFNIIGLEDWYRDVFSQYRWGMEEWRHYYGNCTYDDGGTQSPTLFLMNLYMTTLDPRYRYPLLKALNFMLISQYTNGGWPQRYPLRYEFVHDGLADYTSYHTLNDNAMRDIIAVLLEAYEKLCNEEYLKAVKRGMDFIIISQMPEPQAGWAEQYDMDMHPAWARTHEPKGIMPRQSIQCILQLEQFYLMTGDRRYLKPIPPAIKWMEESTIEILDDGRHKLARYYEPGSNLPIYQHKTDDVNDEGYGIYTWHNDPKFAKDWAYTTVDVKSLKGEYERISALTPEQAMAEYKVKKAKAARPRIRKVAPGEIEKIIDSMDKRGAWVQEMSVTDITKTMGPTHHEGYSARKTIQGISTDTFMRNMNMLTDYLKQIRHR